MVKLKFKKDKDSFPFLIALGIFLPPSLIIMSFLITQISYLGVSLIGATSGLLVKHGQLRFGLLILPFFTLVLVILFSLETADLVDRVSGSISSFLVSFLIIMIILPKED